MKHLIYIIGCSALLSGCKLYSNYERPANLPTEGLYRETAGVYGAAEGDTASFGNKPWREVFTDPHLQQLISKALQQNTSVITAENAIRQAEQGLRVSKLAYFPTLAFSPSGTISSFDGGKASQTYSIPVQASWQIDAFGSIRNTKKQNEVYLEQSRVAKQATNTSIISTVANLYYTLQMLDEQLATTKANAEIMKTSAETMESMMEAGMTNSAGVSQTKAAYHQILASIPTLEQSIESAENQLCNLLHEAPHAIERGKFNADAFPAEMSAGVPLQLLSNRPDVRAAELSLASAFYGVNIARSAFYPQITLSGQAGWTNSAGGMVLNPAKFLASAVASLTQPLFANGQLRAQYKIAKIKQETAQVEFEQKLLDAGMEVSNALSLYQAAEKQAVERAKQVAELEKTVESTDFLFTHGNTTTYLETLTAKQSLLSAQLSLINDKFSKVQAAITLYQALGGGREE